MAYVEFCLFVPIWSIFLMLPEWREKIIRETNGLQYTGKDCCLCPQSINISIFWVWLNLQSSCSLQTEALVEQVLSDGEHHDGWALLEVFRGWMEAIQALSPVFYTKFGTMWFNWYSGVWTQWSWRSFPILMILWFYSEYKYSLTDICAIQFTEFSRC